MPEPVAAVPPERADEVAALRAAVRDELPRALGELAELVAIPSVADADVVDPAECRRAAEWVRDAFAAEGIPDMRLARTPDGTDAVIGHLPAPAGAPTVLLYSHYDVQPADPEGWTSPPFELTERAGRLYGRGAADCKGNIVAHLAALRALRRRYPEGLPVGIVVVCEGSEEQGRASLDRYVEQNPDLFRLADVILLQDAGNAELGLPTLTVSLRGAADVVVRVAALKTEVHSGVYGGAAPDALAALVRILASLRDENGDLAVAGIRSDQRWDGLQQDPESFRRDAGVLPGVRLAGSGSVSDQLWARPTVTILGIDAPDVVGAIGAIQPRAAARLNLRVPPVVDPAEAQQRLADHLRSVAPWGVQVDVEFGGVGHPFRARTDNDAYRMLAEALSDAYDGTATVQQGIGGSIPLATTLATVNPRAVIALMGVEEPSCAIHGTDESVAPSEIEAIALAEALFLGRLAS